MKSTLAATLAILLSTATAATAEDLRGALAAAYNFNASINAQRAATRAADEAIAQAKAGYRPQVFSDAQFGFARTIRSARSSRPATPDQNLVAVDAAGNPLTVTIPGTPAVSGRNKTRQDSVPASFGITVTQPLFQGFTIVNNVNQQEARVRASRAQLGLTVQQTFFQVAQAYADIKLAEELVSVRQQNISFLLEQVRSANARLEVGEGTRTDVAQSQARLELGRTQVTLARSDILTARADLQQFVGRAIEANGPPRIPRRLLPNSLSSALSIAVTNNPAIRAAEHLVDAQAFAVKVAEGELLPSLSASVSGTNSYDLSSPDSRSTDLRGLLTLRVPIYQGGALSAAVRRNKEVLGQTRIELDLRRDQVRSQVRTAWALLQAARSNVRASRAQVSSARLALSGVIEERNVGQRTQLDVLQAQSAVLTAQEQAAQARNLEVVAAFSLLQSIGRLTPRRLGLHVDYYDPKAHYRATVDRWYGLRTPDKR